MGATPLSLQSALLEKSTATSALLTLLLHDCLLHGDEPHLSTWALSVPSPTVQIVCADFLVRYAEPQARWLYLCDWLAEHHHTKRSKKDKEPRWTISTATLQNIAAVLVYGNGQAKARLLQLLHDFDQGQALPVWELHYSAFQEWYSDAIHLAQQHAQQHPPKTPKAPQASWHQRALGAYLGLVRQGNRYSLSALTRMYQLGEQNSELRHSISSSLLTLLNHPQVDFRDYAFEKLQCLDMDLATLGQIATTSPHTDIARKGLQLLVENYPLQQSHQLLQSMIKREHSLLAEEAWKLYKQDVGLYAAAPFALESFTLRLRESCVRELAAQFKDEPAQNLLLQAVGNDHINTRLSAVKTLASHQHPQALPCLMQLLQQEDNEKHQQAIIKTMCLLEDKQTARELLDYREQHSLSEPVIRAIYAAIAAYRDTTLAPRLFKLLEQKPEENKLLQNALLMLSAYDQDIKDYEEKQADCSWLDKQYPRHDALLIELFQHLLKLNYHAEAAKLCRSLAWAKDEAAGTALEAAVKVIDSKHLAAVVNALVYRLEKRQGRAATLLELLSHKDSEIQFLAAEGLANNAHQQGFSILFAALDYNDNDAYRQRAVLALGKSGDERALDKLLKLAEDKEHFLHDVAIEALGHLGKSKSADRILKLLKSNLKQADSYSTVVKHSLNGLRWFNTLDAWQVIYQYIKEHKDPYDYYGNLEHAIGLLQYHDTPATYELLYKLLSQDEQFDTVKAAYHTARLLLKADNTQSCAADYAVVQGYYPVQLDDQILPRIARSAPSADIIRLVQADFKNTSIVLRDLGNALMNREDYQAADLLDLLASQRTEVVGLAARLLTRQHKLNKTAQSALQKALEQAYVHWQLKYRDWHDQPYDTALEERQAVWQNSEATLKQLLWACVRHALQNTRLLDLLSTQQKHERPLQVHVLKALLTQDQLAPALLNAVDGLQSDSVPEVSTLAAQILAKQGSQQTPDWKHFLSQPHTLLNERFAQSLADAAADSAYQAQVLPLLIARQDINTLQTIATDHLQQEALRLGAIEGLARILNTEAAHALQMIRQNSDKTEEVIARAAYRALRRQQRSQAKQAKPVATRGAA
ncbi:MAG: hypothetical protein CR991_08220 [Proteobacteria bacterium]|nr:MAG: hypothetical protein CR991_08220 [Pseudomonadota bacterium]